MDLAMWKTVVRCPPNTARESMALLRIEDVLNPKFPDYIQPMNHQMDALDTFRASHALVVVKRQ